MGRCYLRATAAEIRRVRLESQRWWSADDYWESMWVDAVDTAGCVEALVLSDDDGEVGAVPTFMIEGYESVVVGNPARAPALWPGADSGARITFVHLLFADDD
jgi:hypothetical protein